MQLIQQACEKAISHATTLLIFALLDVYFHLITPNSKLLNATNRKFSHDYDLQDKILPLQGRKECQIAEKVIIKSLRALSSMY